MKVKQRKWYDFKVVCNVVGKMVVELCIYDDIGFWGIIVKVFVNELDVVVKDVDEIFVVVNFGGGDVFDGFVIYNVLCCYSGKVIVCVDGIVVLVVLFVVMVGDIIVMLENVMMMIYNVWIIVVGDVVQMCKIVELFDKMCDGIVVVYCNKCGLIDDEIVVMMDVEMWMMVVEVKECGFVDQIEVLVKLQVFVCIEELFVCFEYMFEVLLKVFEVFLLELL